jgi:hypothetical protein
MTFRHRASVIVLSVCAVLGGVSTTWFSCSSIASAAGISNAWKLAPQADVSESGEQIANTGYAAASWIDAQVPGTVFNSYVLAGKEKDPNFGDNVWEVDRTKYDRNFWYRTDFSVPPSFSTGHVWLNLDGVNRDADVFVNGTKVGSMHGFFQRGRFDVTSLIHVGGHNSLAVLDYVPVLYTIPATQPGKRPPGKYENYSSPAFICSIGWDWMPRVPGLNMGIYKDVYLTHTGDVSIVDPWIHCALPTPSAADITVETQLKNDSGAPVVGTLIGEINPGHIPFSAPASIGANTSEIVSISPSTVAALHLNNPRLWWPNGYGAPNLYTCHLEFRVGGVVSDQKDTSFGIKKYTYTTTDNILRFYINGVRVFLKGGSWGMNEYMLRCNASDYDLDLRLHQDMHMNVIRNWMGMTPDEAFYAACDRYGMMVWDEFWLNNNGGVPADFDLFKANVVEKIKQFRNHPCIALWCGENEGSPPKPLDDAIADDVKTLDGGDRYYQPNSHAGNLSGSGPWRDYDPKQYFQGLHVGHGQQFGMRSELGTAVVTSFDSFKKFMPKDNWWPINSMWNDHFFGRNAGHAGSNVYNADITKRYGKPAGIEDYCRKSQLLNLETNKAMFESWLDHSDKDAAGLIIWMSKSAYPSLVWQTYDYYYDLTGAYFGAKTACEPVHIYWNQLDDRIRVVNTSGKPQPALTAEGWIYNSDGTRKFHQTAAVTSSPDAVADCFRLNYPADLSPVHFIELRLTDASGRVVSENFYWRGTTYLDYTALNSLKPVKLMMTSKTTGTGGATTISADITNPPDSGVVAFAIRPKLVKADSGDQILPVLMSDGYFSLTPGEAKHLTLEFSPNSAGGEEPKLVLECWNNANSAP